MELIHAQSNAEPPLVDIELSEEQQRQQVMNPNQTEEHIANISSNQGSASLTNKNKIEIFDESKNRTESVKLTGKTESEEAYTSMSRPEYSSGEGKIPHDSSKGLKTSKG